MCLLYPQVQHCLYSTECWHYQHNCFRNLDLGWSQIAAMRKFHPDSLIWVINEGQKSAHIDSLGFSGLGCRHLRKSFWQCGYDCKILGIHKRKRPTLRPKLEEGGIVEEIPIPYFPRFNKNMGNQVLNTFCNTRFEKLNISNRCYLYLTTPAIGWIRLKEVVGNMVITCFDICQVWQEKFKKHKPTNM